MPSITEQLDLAKAHLFHIQADIQWAYHDGINPQSVTPSGTKNGALVSDNNEPRSGNLKSRDAYNEACRLLRSADTRLASVLYTHGVRTQPSLTRLLPIELPSALSLLAGLSWRISELSTIEVVTLASVEKPLALIYQTRMSLHACFQDSKAKDEPLEPHLAFCQVCGIRERQHGPRCHTCYVYKLRHNGEERPRSLDKGSSPYEEGKANQAKHGIGYGAR